MSHDAIYRQRGRGKGQVPDTTPNLGGSAQQTRNIYAHVGMEKEEREKPTPM